MARLCTKVFAMTEHGERYRVKCLSCGYEKLVSDLLSISLCPRCGSVLGVNHSNNVFRVDLMGRGVWRYSSLLPSIPERISLGEGLTPISKFGSVWIKNERFNPTGSYADRASAVIISYIKSCGWSLFTSLYERDFTKSLVRYAQSQNMQCRVVALGMNFMDIDDILFLASKNIEVSFNIDNEEKPFVRYANPLTIEGLKTIAFEIYESGVSAERIVVPSETGLLALSILKGLNELRESGIDINYEIVAVSLKNSSPSYLAGVRDVKVVEIGDGEAYEALKNVISKGFNTKPLSALSIYVAENFGKAVAVLTMGFKTLSTRSSNVKRMIIEVLLQEKRPLTAYEIWKTKPVYTLRAVYKALKSMELANEICFDVVSKGMRKTKVYKLC
ncbi:pyridoxal-5'-phosphate-dependent protein subunit beta [Ignisphaera sp. 4213-co]|uniref:Pyridoxal-5'-phosphate-dependent protein subunit beta n=1 Tax=Ignisphaera cupida TaxID=3050454 RepID=A0ABD4Z836_9CREN|nr:pyridoxal-5'-phosphate-dependent protein subunit beta [Ignisphaera sp. 4213-co]MDK6029360.1 pyridoxal-5'-phosphate-dependent protein subunit beta [Ignisphaera sp. 4213-co]